MHYATVVEKSRWPSLRFSLRAVLILAVLVACVFGAYRMGRQSGLRDARNRAADRQLYLKMTYLLSKLSPIVSDVGVASNKLLRDPSPTHFQIYAELRQLNSRLSPILSDLRVAADKLARDPKR